MIPLELIDKSVPIYIFAGKDDTIATVEDANWLKTYILGVKKYRELDGFDHGGFPSVLESNKWFLDDVINDLMVRVPAEKYGKDPEP